MIRLYIETLRKNMKRIHTKKTNNRYKKVLNIATRISVIAVTISVISAMTVVASAILWSKNYDLSGDNLFY